jgi:hypothetical protein
MTRKRPDLAERNRQRAKHNMEGTPTYNVWKGMIQRCINSSSKDFKRYGARGITVCERWLNFQAFLEDMGNKPDGMSIERINNSLGYSKENCQWISPKEQARNRRNNKTYQWNGKVCCVSELAEISGLERKTLEYRLRIGWDVQRAMTTPSKRAA